jgi:hypothetical protein
MSKFSYTRGEKTYTVESKVDESTYKAALDMFAESLGVPGSAVEYLVGYGLKQSLQDSAAQPASAAKAEGGDVTAAIVGAMDKRFDAIIAGSVLVRGGAVATRDPFESMVRRVTAEKLATFIQTPKGAKAKATLKGASKETKSLVSKKFFEANKSAIESEAKRRLESVPVEVELDLSDLTA